MTFAGHKTTFAKIGKALSKNARQVIRLLAHNVALHFISLTRWWAPLARYPLSDLRQMAQNAIHKQVHPFLKHKRYQKCQKIQKRSVDCLTLRRYESYHRCAVASWREAKNLPHRRASRLMVRWLFTAKHVEFETQKPQKRSANHSAVFWQDFGMDRIFGSLTIFVVGWIFQSPP